MQISENKFVTLEYELYVKNDDGSMELMEATTPDNMLKYIHGIGMMMPKFEENIQGKKAGEKFEFSVDCADAYGERSDDNIVDLPVSIFSSDGTIDSETIFEGAIVPLVDSYGERISAEIVKIGEEEIKVDLNHPLAGENLHFRGTVVEVHQANEEELQAMTQNAGGCSSNGCGEEDNNCGCSGCGCGC